MEKEIRIDALAFSPHPDDAEMGCGGLLLKLKDKGYADFKKSLEKTVIEFLEPFRKKQKELVAREVYIKEILNRGKNRAQSIAQITMQEVKEKMGLI